VTAAKALRRYIHQQSFTPYLSAPKEKHGKPVLLVRASLMLVCQLQPSFDRLVWFYQTKRLTQTLRATEHGVSSAIMVLWFGSVKQFPS
jgi:hypothetical protein